ncbi:MAG: hypothetical protein KDE26_09325, partial [Bacteroidetes bacterium]|nr:hypothetical protein [Bacteroidota bacterium]
MMTYFTKEVYLLIEQNETSKASEKLLTILNHGSQEIHEKAVRMIRKVSSGSRRKTSSVNPGEKGPNPASIKRFLTELEKNDLQMVRFLSHIHIAESKVDEGKWGEAIKNYELAAGLHHESFNLTREEIQGKKEYCQSILTFNQYIDAGNQFFQKKDWKNAILAFQHTLGLVRDGYDIDLNQINGVIATCSQGIRFDELIDSALQLKEHEKWSEAAHQFEEALSFHSPDFYPDRQAIEREIDHCHLQIELLQTGGAKLRPTMNKSQTTLLVAIIILLVLAFAYYSYKPATFLDDENTTTYHTEKKAGIDTSTKSEAYTEPEEPEIYRMESALMNVSEETNTQPKENEAEDLDIPPASNLFPNVRTPEEIQELITPVADNEELASTKTSMINENSNGVVEFEAGKIAIIPFCNGLDDDAFSMRIYRDASFAIRASGGSSKTTVSKSLVQAAIDEVGLHTDDFCS